MRIIYFAIVPVLILLALSCTNSSETTGEAANLPANVDSQNPSEEPGATQSFNAENASLSQGSLTVLGLVLPSGMTPANGPDKVYRFEGYQSTLMVFEDIKAQVQSRRIDSEGSGYLIREASVTAPKGNATGNEVIALRIKKRSGGGTTIDLWLEKHTAAVTKGSRSSTYSKSSASRKPNTVKTTATAWKRDRAKSTRRLLRTMERLERGETVTREEMKSSGLD